jgi:hypothetical protein
MWEVFTKLRKRHGRTVKAELEAALSVYFKQQKQPYQFPDEDENNPDTQRRPGP